MKKLIGVFAVLALVCFALPATAVEWNFYGSARMQTFYTSEDFGDYSINLGQTDDTSGVQWFFQNNSRIGATVKNENISGRFELGLKGDGNGDVDVGTRRLFGVWDFGPAKLKVGKDYSPTSQFISAQAFNEDIGLLGGGTMYSDRHGQISLTFGNFEVAVLEPDNDTAFLVPNGNVVAYPKVEALFGMSFDTWNFNIRGGFQYKDIEDVISPLDLATLGVINTNDVDVTSYTIGADAGFNLGAWYIKGAASYSQNPGDADWHLPGLYTFGGNAVFDGDDDTDDTDTIMAALVLGWKFTDMVTFEAGGGYRDDDVDLAGANDDDFWNAYVNATITLAPGVYIIPEGGYLDFMDEAIDSPAGDNDGGKAWYIGGKWQIDF